VVTYRHGFGFAVPPGRLWEQIEALDQHERWWPWLTDLTVDGPGLATGSVLRGVVTPPLPYRMRLSIEIVECERQRAIRARIDGDLTGQSALAFRPDGDGTWVDATWDLEMRQPAMRLASRIGRPLLQWGHDRVVEMTVAGFRRRIRALDP
jgi:uncharacterized protein YndB with AHSA1/START domain